MRVTLLTEDRTHDSYSRRERETMKNCTVAITVLAMLFAAMPPAYARDTKLMLPIDTAMATKDAQDKLDGSVKFFFGKQEYPQVTTKLGTDVSKPQDQCVWQVR